MTVEVAPFGVYVHVPFCARRCDYCAFATWDDRPHLVPRYVEAVRREMAGAVAIGLPPATSVFFGGGTPSTLTPVQMGWILEVVPVAPGAEVTVECNPDDVSVELLAGYLAVGVNRVSLGVQSTVPHVLAALGRTHDPDHVAAAVEAVRQVGFESCNVDLLYGTVGERPVDWERSLADVVSLGVPHVSAYGLTVEAGTPLALDPGRFPDDDDQADKYLAAEEALTAAGLANYEISNWARPGHECRHNLLYWSQGDYRGFGCAAHSHRAGRRWWNLRRPERYLAAVEAGRSAEAGAEELGDDERRVEGLQLSLRTRAGVPASALAGAGVDDLVDTDGGRVRLTVAGRLLANEVAVRLR